MNPAESAPLVEAITGYWPASDQRAKAMVKWLADHDVDVTDARAALNALAEQYDELPSIKQLSVKLAELGASTKRTMGVGDPAVIAGMKARILEFARSAAEREGISLNDRLRREQATHRDYHGEAVQIGDEEGERYYRDRLTAYAELLAPKGAVA